LGEVDEPIFPYLPRGRIEHSVNVPAGAITDPDTGRVRTNDALHELFTKAGVDS
jgi:3-mercaptopyruvate sulfurtransferase SseA